MRRLPLLLALVCAIPALAWFTIDTGRIGYDLRLMSVNDVSSIPDEGVRQVIVARHRAENTLHFRVFNTAERKVVDKSESEYPNKSTEIEAFKIELTDLWDHGQLTNEKKNIIERVTSITGYTRRIRAYFHWAIQFYLFLLLPLYCLSVCGALIRDELQADTLGFLTTRPVTRARLFFLKFLSQIILLELIAFASALLILGVGVSRSIPGIREFMPVFLMSQSLAVLAYGALSSLFGLFTQRYMVLGIIYGFIVEFGIGQIPTNINNLSISRHLRTILANNSTMQDLYRWSQEDTWISVLIMGGAPLVFLLIASIIFTFKEYHHSDDMQK